MFYLLINPASLIMEDDWRTSHKTAIRKFKGSEKPTYSEDEKKVEDMEGWSTNGIKLCLCNESRAIFKYLLTRYVVKMQKFLVSSWQRYWLSECTWNFAQILEKWQQRHIFIFPSVWDIYDIYENKRTNLWWPCVLLLLCIFCMESGGAWQIGCSLSLSRNWKFTNS